MKKNLLALTLLSVSLSHAQILTYVGDQASLTVSSQTLLYSSGSWQNAGNSLVNNSGNIMIVGSASDNFDVAPTSNFNLKYTGSSNYGQLYISGLTQTGSNKISGKVNREYKADGNNGATGSQQIGLPFYNFTSADIKSTLDPTNTNWLNTTVTSLNSAGRFNMASLFKWNNLSARFDQITDANSAVSVGKPTDYIILPRRNSAGVVQWNAATDLKIFKGIPVSDAGGLTQNITLDVTNIPSFGVNGNSKNYYGERYSSYLDDPFALGGGASTWSTYYGKRLNQFANPFLTNIDLYNIARGNSDADADGNALTNVDGIAYYGANDISWNAVSGTTYTTSSLTMAKTGGTGYFQVGDVSKSKLLIKPFQEVMIKFLNDTPTSLNFNGTRTFSPTVRDGTAYSVTGKSANSIPAAQLVRQVAAVLYNSSGDEVGRTYFAVSPTATTGFSPDAKMEGYVTNYTIFTKEESLNGGEDLSQPAQLYINEANEIDFQGKKIPLAISYNEPSTLKFELYEGGERVTIGGNLSNGKSFYISKDNQITKINDGDTMPVNSLSYGLYYEQPSVVLGVNDTMKNQTIIVKKDNYWVVRFAPNWKSSDIEIYSAAGQLLNSGKKVSTGSDYVIPLNNTSGLYLVKATSDKGEVVIKKIVK